MDNDRNALGTGRPRERLPGRVVLITGAGRGQGRAHAVRAAQEGASVVAIDVCADIASVPYPLATKDDLDETARQVREAGGRVVTQIADLRDREAVVAAVAAGHDEFGRLDAAVLNAGVFTGAGPKADSKAAWQDTLDVNLTGTFHSVEAVVDPLVAAGGGAIVIISSAAGLQPMMETHEALTAGYLGYSSTKYALVGLMRSYALALAVHGIRVNTVHPSAVDTPMITNEAVQGYFAGIADVTRRSSSLPVGGPIQPTDISDAVIWLCSDEARYITGVALPVDAGSTL